MHELSVSSAIADTAVRHALGRKVTVVSVQIGHLRQVVPSSLEFYFGIVTKETVCEGARLELEIIPARVRCAGCDREWELDQPNFVCSGCGSEVEVLAGMELEVESIEVEKEEEACIAPQ